MPLPYGFKAMAKRDALALRAEFGVGVNQRFDPDQYFSAYGIPVVKLSNLSCEASRYFLNQRGAQVSGALVKNGSGFVVIDNDGMPEVRRSSTKAHELGHHFLEHHFAEALAGDNRKCGASAQQELEADEFAGELLVPSDGAKNCARRRMNDIDVAYLYGVSADFARWRMNTSGARKFAQRYQAKLKRVA
jgi:Zn-dependent peptidase ImmA (M78 family)